MVLSKALKRQWVLGKNTSSRTLNREARGTPKRDCRLNRLKRVPSVTVDIRRCESHQHEKCSNLKLFERHIRLDGVHGTSHLSLASPQNNQKNQSLAKSLEARFWPTHCSTSLR